MFKSNFWKRECFRVNKAILKLELKFKLSYVLKPMISIYTWIYYFAMMTIFITAKKHATVKDSEFVINKVHLLLIGKRKRTWSGRYLNFTSLCPEPHKSSVINSLVYIAILITNSFPSDLINKTINKRNDLINNRNDSPVKNYSSDNTNSDIKYVKVPFDSNLSQLTFILLQTM